MWYRPGLLWVLVIKGDHESPLLKQELLVNSLAHTRRGCSTCWKGISGKRVIHQPLTLLSPRTCLLFPSCSATSCRSHSCAVQILEQTALGMREKVAWTSRLGILLFRFSCLLVAGRLGRSSLGDCLQGLSHPL